MGFIINKKLIILVSVIVLSICSIDLLHARSNPVKPNELSSLQNLKKKINRTKDEISKLSVMLEKVERNLGKKNKRYIEVVKERKRIEKIIVGGKDRLLKNEEELRKKLIKAQNVLKSLVLKRIQADKEPADMLASKLLIKTLAVRIKTIKEDIELNKSLVGEVNKLEERFVEYVEVENNLRNLLYTLEEEKRSKSEEYYEHIRSKKYLNSKYLQIKSEIKNKKKKAFPTLMKSSKFRLPLVSKKIRFKKKGYGVYLGYKGARPLYATKSGRVVYEGALSTYGNLIMIDHGNGLRSVILGKFKSMIKKGATVKKDDMIGVTNPKWGEAGEVYFEVRKGNKVQKTSAYIDKKYLR